MSTDSLSWRHGPGLIDRPGRPVVFLPGWGFDGRILELITPAPPWYRPEGIIDPARLVDELFRFVTENGFAEIDLIGWSMGANLALDFARRYPEKIRGLYLLALKNFWSPDEIDHSRKELAADPEKFLVSFYRKCLLNEGEAYRTFKETLQPVYLRQMEYGLLDKGLSYLAGAKALASPIQKTRLIHGRRDIIVPLPEMADPAGAQVEILARAGHMVLMDPGCSLRISRGKSMLIDKFSRAAATYDQYADLQDELAHELTARLPAAIRPRSILELGCGTGRYTARLADRFPQARILALDFSHPMLERAETRLAARPKVELTCEDAEVFLGRSSRSFDLITANSSMQWFADPAAAIGHIARLLAADGLLHACLFGPRTLRELADGLSFLFDEDFRLPARNFMGKEVLRGLLTKHLAGVEIDEEIIFRRYKDLPDLLRHIRGTGTGGRRPGPPPAFSRGRLRRLDRWFMEHCGGCRAGYQVFMVRCRKR